MVGWVKSVAAQVSLREPIQGKGEKNWDFKVDLNDFEGLEWRVRGSEVRTRGNERVTEIGKNEEREGERRLN